MITKNNRYRLIKILACLRQVLLAQTLLQLLLLETVKGKLENLQLLAANPARVGKYFKNLMMIVRVELPKRRMKNQLERWQHH